MTDHGHTRATLLLATVLAASTVFGQTRTSAGAIAGTVLDADQRPVPGASVTAVLAGREEERSSQTNEQGLFAIAPLPPGTYRLTVAAPGYSALTIDDVDVLVGETRPVRAQIAPTTTPTFHVDVQATMPAVEVYRTEQARYIDSTRLQSLPINRRNYLDFALLTPDVVETATLAEDADFRIPTTFTSGIAFAGGNGRGNVFTVDGLDYTGSFGNVRSSLPQVAVREFQVIRANQSAEIGGGYGGAVNIVSRSGSNDWHGSVFGYLRHRSLQARNFFDPGKSSYTRVQSGTSLSGPLRRDRTFFFFGLERLDRQETVFVPILQDQSVLSSLKPSQTALLDFLGAVPGFSDTASALRIALTPSSNPNVTQLFAQNSGTFPFSGHLLQPSLRLDHRFTDRVAAFLRANLTHDDQDNTRFGALTGLSRGSQFRAQDRTLAAEVSWTASPQWISITRASYAYSRLTFTPNDPIGPALDISGFGFFNRDPQFPSDAWYRNYQIQQTFSRTVSRTSLRFGAEYLPLESAGRLENFFGGRFIFGEFVPLGAVLDAFQPGSSQQLGAALAAAGRADLVNALADPINSLQAFSLGIPVLYLQNFGNPYTSGIQHRLASFVDGTIRLNPRLTLQAGLRFQFDDHKDIPANINLSPRFGFAWSPGSSARFVLRGGYSLMQNYIESYIPFSATAFQRTDANLVAVPLTGVPGFTNPFTGQPPTSADIYNALLTQGILGTRTIRQEDLAVVGLPAGLRYPVTGGLESAFRNPYSQQGSLEAEWSVGQTVLSVGGLLTRTLHLPRTRDHNLKQTGTRPDGWPIFGPVDPFVANNYVLESAANAFHQALIVTASRRLRGWLSFYAHYTASRTRDEVTDFNIDYTPHNQLDARADRALSAFHRGHQVGLDAVLQSPGRPSWGSPAVQTLARDWTLSPIFRYLSSRPFNIITGYDNLGDGQPNTHRPLGLGRNAGRGPDFLSLDLRLARSFPVSETIRIQFTAEAFNVMNRTNFRSVNNVVGAMPLESLPNPLEGHPGNPVSPFSFTSALDPRQFQLGLNLSF